MDALSRSLIRSSQIQIVTTTVSTRFVVLAFAVRAYVRDLSASMVYLMIIVPRIAPAIGDVIRYAMGSVRPSRPHDSAAAPGREKLHARAIGDEPVGGTVQLPSAEKEIAILRDERVVRLQRRVVTHVFSRLPGVRLAAPDLTVLARFSSASWLLRNLLVAAGCADGMPRSDLAHRLSVVYPVFIVAMRTHAGHLEGRPPSIMGRRRLGRRARRLRGVGPNGEIVSSLYPESLKVERLLRQTENARHEGATRIVQFRVAELRGRYERYLDAVTLVITSAHGQYGPADELRVMKSVLTSMEDTWQRGRTTAIGTRAGTRNSRATHQETSQTTGTSGESFMT